MIQKLVAFAPPVIFAITVHEAAHGYAAKFFGDLTAYKLGRITLNPFKHIDPVGTVLLPVLSLTLGGILFGWAKPVPVNFYNLREPKKNMFWVALAGPASNFFMAMTWGLLLFHLHNLPTNSQHYVAEMSMIGIQINLVLLALNMLPLPPLDGGRIAVSLLPMPAAMTLSKIEPYGLFILMGLLFTGILGSILMPVLLFLKRLLTMLMI